MKTDRIIGSSRIRTDAKNFVQGRGSYLDDVPIAGVLQVAFLRSPYAQAKILAIRTESAAAVDGVFQVVTAADIQGLCQGWRTSQTYPGFVDRLQAPLAEEYAVFAGQPIVAVVAESRAVAEDALELIEIDFEPSDGACLIDRALDVGAGRAHADLTTNVAYMTEMGDQASSQVFDDAAVVVEEAFKFHRQTGCSMETRGCIASYLPGDDSMTIYQSHTAPQQLRSLYAMHLGMEEGRIRVIAPHVGGSFGVKIHLYSDELATAAIARLIGRPVKYIADRLESFLSDIHAREHNVTAKLAVDRNGRFLAWEAYCLQAIGPFSTHPGSSVQEGDEAMRVCMAPYQIPFMRAELDVVFQNKTMTGQYRGVGHPIGVAVTEHMIDKAAAALGMLPEVIRQLNYIPDDAYPVTSRTGVKLEALSHQKCMARLLELLGLPRLRAEHVELRKQGIYRGIGFAAFVERTATNAAASAHIRKATAQDGITLTLDPSGAVRCSITVTDQGQGTHAVIGQIVADELGVDPDRVTVVSGDSQSTPYGSGVRASRGTAIGGELALQASREFRSVLLNAAARLLETQPQVLKMKGGYISSCTGSVRSITISELAEVLYFKPQLLPPGPQVQMTLSRHLGHDWPGLVPTNGIQASLVEVDPRTGFVKLLKHWAVDDFGTVVNPMLVSEQVRGGIAQGIGQALYEELVYTDEGQLTNGTFADYCIPLAADMPDIVVEHVETPWPHTALGAKGAGEAGTTGAVGAVLNAVNDAIRPLGARISETPMTPLRVLKALGRL